MTYKWGIVDEHRKLLYATAIIDATHFRGVWHGQQFEVRCLPDSSAVTVGDFVFTHVLPGNSELVAIFPPIGALYFTPGGQGLWPVGPCRGELWKVGASGIPALVWTATNDWEFITCLFWSQVDSNLYMGTWRWLPPPAPDSYRTYLYRINRTTGVCTEIWHRDTLGSILDITPDPIADAAEYTDGKIYLNMGYFNRTEIYRFDPVVGTMEFLFTPPEFGWMGGIAIDPTAPAIVITDGYKAWRSPTGDVGSWVEDFNFYLRPTRFADTFSLITHKGDGNYIYSGMNGGMFEVEDDVVWRRTGAGAWAMDLNHPDPANDIAVDAFTVEYDAAGVVQAIYAQFWSWWSDTDPHVYRKPVGGIWVLDWDGPWDGEGKSLMGMPCQGLQQFQGKVYGLWYDFWGATIGTQLHRRDGAGNWPLVQRFENYYNGWTYSPLGPMAIAPNNLFKCHEV